ncbi:MAG: hypothetical protein CL946_08085 [Ectothiorhodospiraceae bacterium]|nr:hypothetical protein [Ectothiorhodospiraceae bacterium]
MTIVTRFFKTTALSLIAALALFAAHGVNAQQTERPALHAADFFAKAPAHSGSLAKESNPTLELTFADNLYDRVGSTGGFTLEEFPLPGGGAANLDVRSFSIFTDKTVIKAVTASGEVTRPLPSIALFTGTVAGKPHSWVYIAVEPSGVSGTIIDGMETYNLYTHAPSSGQVGDATLHVALTDQSAQPYTCNVDDAFVQNEFAAAIQPQMLASLDGLDTLDAIIAVDADYEAFQHYGSEEATENYVIARMGESSAIYERDVSIKLTLGQMRVFTTQDPYPANSDNEALNVFTQYWKENMGSVERTLAIMISRKPISAAGVSQGLAWVGRVISDGNYSGVLCSEDLGYAFVKFSANNNFISGHVGVLAHEIGHNFGSPHTHSCYWNPPIDSCYRAEARRGEGACFSDGQRHLILGGGELMSYCHLGGYGNNAKHNEIRERCGLHIRGRADAALCMSVTSTVRNLELLNPIGGEQICAGQSLTITWNAEGNNDFSILLSRDDGVTYDTVIFSNVNRLIRSVDWQIPNNFPVGSQYRIRIIDNKNNTLVDEMGTSFEVLPGTVVTRFSPDRGIRYVCVGEGANFNLDAIGSGELTYQWYRDGQPIDGQTTDNLQLENLDLGDNNTLYHCIITGDCGPVSSDTAMLRVFDDPILVNRPSNDTVCIGETARFTVEVDGPNLQYEWRGLLSGKVYPTDGPDLEIPNVTQDDRGGMQITVNSSCGQIMVSSFFLVIAQPGVTVETPIRNEKIATGSEYEITWDQHCLSQLKIEYSANDGSDYNVVAPSVQAEDGSYMWSVPTQPTNNARIRITDLNDPSKTHESDRFQIRDEADLKLSPVELGFSWVSLGESRTNFIVLENTGRADLEITRTDVVGSASVTVLNGAVPGTALTIAPGATYNLDLRYEPTELELLDAVLEIDHNGADTTTLVPLTGESFVPTSTPQIPVAEQLTLHQNYPNPVVQSIHGQASFIFDMPAAANVTLTVYNSIGQKVMTLVDEYAGAGRHTVTFPVGSLSPGVYAYRLTSGDRTATRLMHIIR